MRSGKHSNDLQKMKTYGFVTGAVLLLAVLTVVLCVMAGAFDFSRDGGADAQVTAPQPENTGAKVTPPQESTPAESPDPTPTKEPEKLTWHISAIAGKGGSLEPSGMVSVEDGKSVTFVISPEDGYVLSQIKVDGENVQAGDTYTFENVSEDHTIYAVFRLAPRDEAPETTDTPAGTGIPSSPTDIG